MTAAERQQRKRDRLKAGLVRVDEWVPAGAETAVRAAIDAAVQAFIAAQNAAKGDSHD